MTEETYKTFDENFNETGVASRSEVHSRGLWHETFHCWLFRVDSVGNTKVLFQLRAPTKSLFPDYLDISAAGHIHSDEAPIEGRREIEEELGIDVDPSNLIYMGIRPDMAKIGDVTNREFCHTYIFNSNIEPEEINFDTSEVYGVVEISLDDGIRLFSGETQSIEASGVLSDETGHRKSVKRKISISDIIPRVDRYYLKVFLNIERYLDEGAGKLAV